MNKILASCGILRNITIDNLTVLMYTNIIKQIKKEALIVKEIDICDICEGIINKEDLINIDPQMESTDDEDWENFDGMICDDCYNNIYHGK